ncbi:paired domain-containing protein [Trichonephila clavipes]|nr:paired domain-containing protein [Trichonephila clavipes]
MVDVVWIHVLVDMDSFYFDLCVYDNVKQKVCYFRVVSSRKTTVCLLNVPRQTVSDAICCFKELGNDGRHPGSGRKHTVNTSKNHKRIQRNPRISMRQIARDRGKTKIVLKPYKLRKV